MRIYPESIENELDLIIQHSPQLIEEFNIKPECMRNVFGEYLFDMWVNGIERDESGAPFDEDKWDELVRLSIAHSLYQDMLEDGIIDAIDDGDGNEYVFVTQKGKDLKFNIDKPCA